ncbi:hypothetical protein ATPR_2614 [Acetobacter tropicalis NBRC 101654]|uniref:Uncharacterized protein n=1 Tax=Acetobacter tropicalis NBRC 101654 TaxID=749388 RepID=F7VGW5_9PROT|nr:hypothetical protein ATPR_2614 [Acetobacter tropicalis NBRC 101654]
MRSIKKVVGIGLLDSLFFRKLAHKFFRRKASLSFLIFYKNIFPAKKF